MPVDLTRLRQGSVGEGLRHPSWAALLVIAAATLPYLSTINDYFVQDDFGVVSLLSSKPWWTFPRWFYTTWMDHIWGYTPDEIRPFPALSFQLAALGGAAAPPLNHAINIAFHAANAVLVMWIASRTATLGLMAAACAGLVFAVLPVQAETVAWITGRVDSMPAFFYLAAFLLYVRGGRARMASTVVFAAALFSKQNTITFAPAIVLYDLLVARRPVRISWQWVRPYMPYVVLTAGYLLLRYAVFGQVAREGMLTGERLGYFAADSIAHLRHVMFGAPTAGGWIATAAVVVAVAAAAIGRHRAAAVYFGAVWIVLGIAPTLVAGYSSPRHVYLAAAGWAVFAAIAIESVWEARPTRVWRPTACATALAIIAVYCVRLLPVVADWHVRAAVSRRATADLEREAAVAPAGTLVMAGAPTRSWGFALPFAARPPFAATDLTMNVTVISDSSLHCCAANQWEPYTRAAMRAWLARPDRAPVVALYWNPRSGALSRLTDADDPYLRALVDVLLRTDGVASLDEAFKDTFENLVAPHVVRDR